MLDAHHEDCGEATPFHYSVPNLRVTFGRAKRNIGARPTCAVPARVPGLYATESAMNELADQLKIDPVKLRILNEPKIDEREHPVLLAPYSRVLSSSARKSSAGRSARRKSAR